MTELHVVGPSGSGKTTLILGLIALLQRDRVQVAAIKHHHGGLSPERKDSARLFATGTPTVLLAQDGVLEMARAPSLDDARRRLPPSTRLVLVEGIKEYPGPKVWVGPGCPPDLPGLLAVVAGAAPPGCLQIAERDARVVYRQVIQPLLAGPDGR